jgi:phosphoglucomutase
MPSANSPPSAQKESEMDERMTLEQVRDVLREMNEVGYWYSHSNSMHIPVMKMADAIDAHIAQPAQAVDVEAIREVALALKRDSVHGAHMSGGILEEFSDKLAHAIGNAQAEGS